MAGGWRGGLSGWQGGGGHLGPWRPPGAGGSAAAWAERLPPPTALPGCGNHGNQPRGGGLGQAAPAQSGGLGNDAHAAPPAVPQSPPGTAGRAWALLRSASATKRLRQAGEPAGCGAALARAAAAQGRRDHRGRSTALRAAPLQPPGALPVEQPWDAPPPRTPAAANTAAPRGQNILPSHRPHHAPTVATLALRPGPVTPVSPGYGAVAEGARRPVPAAVSLQESRFMAWAHHRFTMTPECALLLPGVCAALADPRQPCTDDTCLEKLLDWFRVLTRFDPTVNVVRDNPCLTELIASVLALPEPSPRILSFVLRLAGILAASETRFQHLQQEQLLVRLFGRDGPLNSALWEDASVRSGWVAGVHSMVHHQPALHFLCNGGGIDVILTLQGDPSLFVASAASQLLVHVLTFSVESETTKPLSATDCDWPACAQMIIKHIEDSLQSSSASHIEQSLKLLTGLFHSCHAMWTKVLWLGIAKQIKSFLMEETVQAQHVMANLLLKMARSPVFSGSEGSFWALVTSALEHFTPVQAGPLAVGLLRLYKCPQDVRMQALTVLLQPMDCILRAASQPLEYAGLLDESVSDPATVESLLSSKSSCASLLCQTLAHLEQLLSLIHLHVDLPYASLLRSLMAILQFCNGFLSPASPLGSTISRILINCFRVQKSALGVLAALLEREGCDALIGSLFDVLLPYLESPNTSPTVLKKAFQATSKWLVRLQRLSCSNSQWQQTEKILEDVFLVLQKRLCSPCWEVRDSSLEFLTVLIKYLRDQDEFRRSLLSSEVPRLTENLLEDPESYVRASAVTAVGHLAFITCFAPESPVIGIQYNKENTVAKLQEILSTDSEGFPRRAVIKIFTEWLRQGCTGQLEDTEQFVSRVIQIVEHDLDWEVRLGGLELVNVFCSRTFCQLGRPKCPYAPVLAAVTISVHPDESLQIFCRAKLFGFLFRSLCDCDKPLGQRACDLLLYLKSNFYPFDTMEDSQQTEDSPPGPSITWLRRTLRQGSLAQNFLTEGGNGVDFQDPESMMLALGTVGLEDLHDELNRCSDHVEKSPQSLLRDILATVGTVEENEADCY